MEWTALLTIAMAGMTGGLVGGLVPRGSRTKLKLDDQDAPYQPGLVASIVIGAFAAVAAWGLNENVAGLYLVGQSPTGAPQAHVTVGELVAAMGTGLAGFKWLSNHWSSKLNSFIAQQAALAEPDVRLQAAIAEEHPERALERLRVAAS